MEQERQRRFNGKKGATREVSALNSKLSKKELKAIERERERVENELRVMACLKDDSPMKKSDVGDLSPVKKEDGAVVDVASKSNSKKEKRKTKTKAYEARKAALRMKLGVTVQHDEGTRSQVKNRIEDTSVAFRKLVADEAINGYC